MGINLALAEPLQSNSCQETPARMALAFDLELLMIDVQASSGVLFENAVLLPIAQMARGTGIAVGRFRIARFFLVENEANDVMRAALVERLLERGIDDVVRRRDHVAKGADAAQV